MAVSLNSVVSFNPTANYHQVTRSNIKVLSLKVPSITSLSGPVALRQSRQGKKSRFYFSAAEGDNVATETSDNVSDVNSLTPDDKVQSSGEVGYAPQVSEVSNGTVNSTNLNEEASEAKSTSKRASLTARERLRAARVLSRYTDSKPSKPQLQSKLIESLKETDKGKRRPGLPQAPTDLLDDSKRGMPKQGWTIELPVGMDVFFVVFSFVFISSVMFATTYIVWKVGAIHFNEN